MAITTTNTSERLYSLDALRGFDMFWIMVQKKFFMHCLKLQAHLFGELFQRN